MHIILIALTLITTCCMKINIKPSNVSQKSFDRIAEDLETLNQQLETLNSYFALAATDVKYAQKWAAELVVILEANGIKVASLLSVPTDDLPLVISQVRQINDELADFLSYLAGIENRLMEYQLFLLEKKYKYEVVEVKELCGNVPGSLDPKGFVLKSGAIIVFDSVEDLQKMTIIESGPYTTTDGCYFEVYKEKQTYGK